MEKYQGKSVSGGYAAGKIYVYQKKNKKIERVLVSDSDREILRFQTAINKAREELLVLYDKALKEAGEESAAIFEAHQMILADETFCESVERIICDEMVNAEYAVSCTKDKFVQMFLSMDDFMKERALDVMDVAERILRLLTGEETVKTLEEPVILLAKDLSPSEVVALDRSRLLSIVTYHGAANSHTAILARSMNIPALVGIPCPDSVDASNEMNGKMAIVDGDSGTLIIDPDSTIQSQYQEKLKLEEEQKKALQSLIGKPCVTLDGKEIALMANVSSADEVTLAMENDACGIGLFRSEFLYLERDDFPSEEDLFEVYKKAVLAAADKQVIVRTIDIGADKQATYFGIEEEENPALGYRAIRICLDREDVFQTQLRALYRASVYGNLSIMFPMIISVEEVRRIKAIITKVREELTADGISFGDPKLGIMIETPAAVMISDLLAKEVDFFSIGTNDLSQYTLAIDRQNPKLEAFYDPHHPAILRMIQMVIENGHKENIMVGICGELAADTSMTETFLRMGVDELSVATGSLLKVKSIICNVDISNG